ncbi:IQ domain-containing protein K-like isoform X2 [Corticium candelabrum]|uniref:IQ domain-containing protein K-like isoform X2 n=1 Tax=Corticium candelabrum TaxID=121492 RepID=UPI002E319741|nr:IQ domain-containing protein K-like isoform X2 [Corticium candelabrum]
MLGDVSNLANVEDSEEQLRGGVMPENLESRPREYLKKLVFPVLLPGIEHLLKQCNQMPRRKKIHFNPIDFLAEYLYRNNPIHKDREMVLMNDVEFVQRILVTKPRPPLPLSATLTEEEAATIIQSWYRGHVARCDSDVQEFRQWMKKLRKEIDAARCIQLFWRQKQQRCNIQMSSTC